MRTAMNPRSGRLLYGRSICLALAATAVFAGFAGQVRAADPADRRLDALEKEVRALKARLQAVDHAAGIQQDVEEIRRLQYTYGYYMDKQLYGQVVSLFSANPVSVEWGGGGVFYGRAGLLKRYGNGKDLGPTYGVLLDHLQLQGVVHVADDRKTAKARFRALIMATFDMSNPGNAQWQGGVYENEYVREGGVWKLSKLEYKQSFSAPVDSNWIKDPLFSSCAMKDADAPTTWYHPYPENALFPLHYPNPVTGKTVVAATDPTHYWVGNWPGEFGQCGTVKR